MNNLDWQPIKTAPKDGTEILLFEKGEIVQAFWGGAFHNAFLTVRGIGFVDKATHWAELPPSPKKKKRNSKNA